MAKCGGRFAHLLDQRAVTESSEEKTHPGIATDFVETSRRKSVVKVYARGPDRERGRFPLATIRCCRHGLCNEIA
jgi:hypothetical protein